MRPIKLKYFDSLSYTTSTYLYINVNHMQKRKQWHEIIFLITNHTSFPNEQRYPASCLSFIWSVFALSSGFFFVSVSRVPHDVTWRLPIENRNINIDIEGMAKKYSTPGSMQSISYNDLIQKALQLLKNYIVEYRTKMGNNRLKINFA